MTNSSVSGNSANGSSGGIYNSQGGVVLTNSHVDGNVSNGLNLTTGNYQGGGIRSGGIPALSLRRTMHAK